MTLSAGWKNFDLSVFMQGVTGTNRYFSRDVVGSFIGDTSHPSTNWLDAWTPENTNAEWPRLFLEENSISSPQRVNSSFWCMNTNYLRIKNVNFGYTLPKSWTNKLGIANAKIYYTGENLFTSTVCRSMLIRSRRRETWMFILLAEAIHSVLM